MKAVLETTVVEQQHESHEQFMTRRSGAMAGMIGMLQSRLEILDIELSTNLQFSDLPKESLLHSMKDMRVGLLETLIKFNREWATMQQYEDTDSGKEMNDRRYKEYTTKLDALKTLVL